MNLFQKVWRNHSGRNFRKWPDSAFCRQASYSRSDQSSGFWYAERKRLGSALPERTFATVDHIVPTDEVNEPYSDSLADAMIKELRKNCEETGVTFFDVGSGKQGIVHVVGLNKGSLNRE